MSGCPSFAGSSGAGIAAALRGVDCQAGEATAFAFGRLFGADGRLLAALTLLLTLYVAFFAIGLLTGRSRIGLATLTPRMLTLGLVLTFATSWAAYQNVVWTLATGAPDELARVLTGSRGPATIAFADRLDRLFTVVTDAADQASRPAKATETGITPATPMVGGFTAATVLALSSAMLLLGTVGVLVTTKVALAAMLALGPIFIVLALFPASRGLFEGWLRAVVLFASVPLLAVLIGSGAVVALEPVARSIALAGAEPSTRAVGVLFVGATVYCALMAMAIRTAAVLVAGWRPFGRDADPAGYPGAASAARVAAGQSAPLPAAGPAAPAHVQSGADERVRAIVAALPAPPAAGPGDAAAPSRTAVIVPLGAGGDRTAPPGSVPGYAPGFAPRAESVGNRFRTRPSGFRNERLS